MRTLYILGTSGLARETALVAAAMNARTPRWERFAFIGSTPDENGRNLGFGPVAGDDAWLLGGDLETDIAIGIGFPQVRAKVLARYLQHGTRFQYPNLVHPQVDVARDRIILGRGNVITQGCAFTCDIAVGDFNLFNLNVTVGHDARIGSFNVFNPSVNISGGVHVGDRVLAGTGSQILENREVGDDAVIGAGAVVRQNVEQGQTVVGVPAKPMTAR